MNINWIDKKIEEWNDTNYTTGEKPNQNENWVLTALQEAQQQERTKTVEWMKAHYKDQGGTSHIVTSHEDEIYNCALDDLITHLTKTKPWD